MQNITVVEIRPLETKNHKPFCKIIDEHNSEYTTFDTAISKVLVGSLLKIEVKVDGKYVNIDKWEVVRAGPDPNAAPGPGGDSPIIQNGDYTKTKEFNEIKNKSIEDQNAFTGAIELMKAMDKVPEDILERVLYHIRCHLPLPGKKETAASVPAAASVPVTPETAIASASTPAHVEQPGVFNNAGEFLAKCKEVFGCTKTQILSNEEAKGMYDRGEYAKLYLVLTEARFKKA
jgi:hypothetical protein